MAIYRGPGGSSDATNDATSQAILASASAVAAAASEAAAATSATSAANSATAASSSASAAASSEASVAANASNAATSATNAASSATAAANSASAASTSETNADSSASAAATSATNAANSATSAANSATTATTQATNASNSATAAATSATNAANSATSAATSETNAASSASAASTSATNAANSATSASNSASTATTQASNAATSATAAATSATNAAASETNAASSASAASTSATNAANSASAAASSATSAAGSATSAAGSATAAASSAVDAQSSEDAAAAYAASINPANFLQKASNLSDLTNTATARTNLGVAIGSNVQAYDADLDAVAGSNVGSQIASYGVNGIGFRNRIINGAMMIDQRNAGASVSSGFSVDRFGLAFSVGSKFTAQQNAGSVTPPAGFTNYLGATSSSSYSISASDYFNLYQNIEGFNSADLGWGSSGAQSVTLSFWVRSSLTGTFGGSLRNGSANYSYPFTFAVSAANTWEQKTIVISGPTAGTWNTTNGLGIGLNFGLGVGSTYSASAGSWAASNLLSATGATSVVGTNGATFYITGVQLEKGSTATSFDYRPYGTELALCQRYYCKTYDIATAPGTATYTGTLTARVGATDAYSYAGYFTFPISMRAGPTVTVYNPQSGATGTGQNNVSGAFAASLTQTAGTSGVNIQANNVSISVGTSNYVHATASAEL